ncbi:MAG: hypothetical protein K5839_06145 [Treponemataceae bacterium]|nr:hypothetical protein [Treponemataceae bacterium]
MKKSLVILTILFLIPVSAFSKCIINLDAGFCAFELHYTHNCFANPEKTDSSLTDFVPFSNSSISVLYEFPMEKNIHPYVGGNIGYALLCFDFSAEAGAFFTLKEFNKINLELNCGSDVGYGLSIFLENFFYVKPYISCMIIANNRKGFFGNVGISLPMISTLDFFESYGYESNFFINLAPSISAGYHF